MTIAPVTVGTNNDKNNYGLSAAALTAIGGLLQITVTPVAAPTSAGQLGVSSLTAYQRCAATFVFPALGKNLTGHTIELVIWDRTAAQTVVQSHSTNTSAVTISGGGNDIVTANLTTSDTATADTYAFVVVDRTDGTPYFTGSLTIEPIPALPAPGARMTLVLQPSA